MHILKQLLQQRLYSLAWCDINTFKLRLLWALMFPTDQYLLNQNINSFLLGELRIIFQYTNSPTRGTILPFNTPFIGYAWPVFRSSLLLRLFHSDCTAVFFSALRSPVFILCGQIYILWFIQCRNADFIKWTLVISSVWIRIIT